MVRAPLLAAVAVSGLILAAQPSSATLVSGGVSGVTVMPALEDGFVQKVHGWHCSRRYGWFRGRKWRHRHIRACDDYDDDYYPYTYGGYYPGPFIGFGIDFDDDNHGHKHKKKKYYKKKGGKKDWDD
jgi:hypothetical protein